MPPTPNATSEKVRFLGLDLAPSHAEVALYVLFAISVTAALCLVIVSYVYGKLKKQSTPRAAAKRSQM